jgi:oxygen-dependent protoporphyrinogen oxidase
VAPSVPNVKAKALTHATAKWPWLADEAGPGSHVLRLSYGRAVGQQGAEDFTGWNDDELYRQALADASSLMGVGIGDDDVVGWKVVRWIGALPSATVGHRDRVAAVRRELAAYTGVDVTGAWLAGTGLVAVVGDARRRSRELAARLQPAA